MSYTKDLISETLTIKRKIISIKNGKDLDRKFPLVNMADELAHFLFRNCSLEDLCNNPYKVELLK